MWCLQLCSSWSNCFVYFGSLWFLTHFRIVLFITVKNAIENLMGVALYLQIIVGSKDIFTILTFLVHAHKMIFHLSVSSLISFINVVICSVQVFHLWLNLFLSILILFVAIVNGIIFLISFLYSSLFMYGNAHDFYVDFYIMQLYWIILLILIVFGGVFRYSIDNIMVSANRQFCLFFFYLDAFYLFFLSNYSYWDLQHYVE